MNRTALHLAALTGNADIYRRLVELGFDSKSLDQKGKTAEHYLRNNPAISSGELQELLALSNPSGVAGAPINTGNHTVNGNTRLSKMAGGNKTSNKEVINKDVAANAPKISSKPVRLQPLQQQQQPTKDNENIGSTAATVIPTKITVTSPTKRRANGKSTQEVTPATSSSSTNTSGDDKASQLATIPTT